MTGRAFPRMNPMSAKSNIRESKSPTAGTLYVVGTPIGNLEDVTLRALRVLKEADLIAAEDTRRTRKLLSRYDIHTPMASYHEHNKRTQTPRLIEKLKQGARVALVSDAGMPGISDPGHDLIARALEEKIEVTAAPGPSSIISALVLSGMPTDRFSFIGFVPRKSGERKRCIEDILRNEATAILFESPNRLVTLLETVADLFPERKVAVARELTKKFEQVLRGTAAEVAGHFQEQKPRGECVIVIEGTSHLEEQPADTAPSNAGEVVKKLMRDEGLSKKDAMRKAAKELGITRRELYRLLLEEKRTE